MVNAVLTGGEEPPGVVRESGLEVDRGVHVEPEEIGSGWADQKRRARDHHEPAFADHLSGTNQR